MLLSNCRALKLRLYLFVLIVVHFVEGRRTFCERRIAEISGLHRGVAHSAKKTKLGPFSFPREKKQFC